MNLSEKNSLRMIYTLLHSYILHVYLHCRCELHLIFSIFFGDNSGNEQADSEVAVILEKVHVKQFYSFLIP